MRETIYDIEVAPNRAMVGFLDVETGEITQIDGSKSKKLRNFVKNRTLIGFNNLNYDDLILTTMIRMPDSSKKNDNKADKYELIYSFSKKLVEDKDVNRWDFKYLHRENTIDLMEVAPGQASLKLYGARLNTKMIQDLPYGPHEKHNKKMWKNVCEYNKIDLQVTLELYKALKPQLDLRADIGKQYDINVMSRSDAQVAEDIFVAELGKTRAELKKGKKIPKSLKYDLPETVKFIDKDLNDLAKRITKKTKILLNKGGAPMMPEWLAKQVIVIGKTSYNIGLGGLHSMEKSMAVTGMLGNVDVASYYPSLIEELHLYPEHLGKEWLTLYSTIKSRRLKAKQSGDMVTSNMLKIVLNGSYGKLGSFYSFLYAPKLMLQVTFTGQLYLLMLIEAIENIGVQVISANTDGVEVLYKSDDDKIAVSHVVTQWEETTGMKMEFGSYLATYNRDVNNYIAVYDGYTKRKGFYGKPSLAKNPQHPIVQEAIAMFLSKKTPMEETIRGCTDVSKFCVSRAVTGGALWSNVDYPNTSEYKTFIKEFEAGTRKDNKALRKRNMDYKKQFVLKEAYKRYIGKTVRFYYSTKGKSMFYAKSGNTVPLSDGCKPMMKLKNKVPKDLDYDRYIELADKYLKDVGYE